MSFKTLKFKWARKLLKAKMFVVMTEKESAIAVDGADPYSFTDAIALAAQSAELEMFNESLSKLVADHKDALEKLGGIPDEVKPEKEAAVVNRKVNAKPVAKTSKPVRQPRAKVRGSKTTQAKVPKKKA